MLLVWLLLSVLFIILATVRLRLHPFLALLLAGLGFGLATGMPPREVVKSVNEGFGGTIGQIGIVILFGSIIGAFLEKSGGARQLAESILKVTGEKRVPLAMSFIGYIVSIPVFCDSGFVLLSPLNKALTRRAGIPMAMGAMALSLGLYATHTMVPPTPGPVAAADLLDADLGWVILFGMVAGAVATAAGWGFSVTAARRVTVAGDSIPVPSPETDTADAGPSLVKSLLPIVLPIVLIVLASISDLPDKPFGTGTLAGWLGFLGQPVVALLLGVGAALALPRRLDREMLSSSGWVGEAVLAAAAIIIITGAGGAFGKVLQNSGIAAFVGETLKGRESIGLWLPFIIAAGIKTAQGSSTVAIITTAGLVAPLLAPLGLDGGSARALTAVMTGAGAMIVSHANDSYFWVVTQFSGMNLRQGYRLQTLGTLVEGLAAGVTVWCMGLLVL